MFQHFSSIVEISMLCFDSHTLYSIQHPAKYLVVLYHTIDKCDKISHNFFCSWNGSDVENRSRHDERDSEDMKIWGDEIRRLHSQLAGVTHERDQALEEVLQRDR